MDLGVALIGDKCSPSSVIVKLLECDLYWLPYVVAVPAADDISIAISTLLMDRKVNEILLELTDWLEIHSCVDPARIAVDLPELPSISQIVQFLVHLLDVRKLNSVVGVSDPTVVDESTDLLSRLKSICEQMLNNSLHCQRIFGQLYSALSTTPAMFEVQAAQHKGRVFERRRIVL